jgi:transposase InsO family protein
MPTYLVGLAVRTGTGYITGYSSRRPVVGDTSQKRAIKNYRKRLRNRGMARFEVLGLDGDRDLIRSLARRLAEDGPDASRLRAVVSQTISGEPPRKGGILAALRRSPLVGADITSVRRFEAGRKVEL